MANLSKKWGAVIGCWTVALVLIITGVCLGLTIPSSAAEEYEGDIAVTFNGETTIYHTMQAAFDAASACETTADNPVNIQLKSNVTSNTAYASFDNANWQFDLNGYVWSVGEYAFGYYGGTLHIIDSRSEAVHYYAYVGNGKYEFDDEAIAGFSPIYGGTIVADNNSGITVYAGVNDCKDAQLILYGGTYLGKGAILSSSAKEQYTANIVINDGVNWQCYIDANDVKDSVGTSITGRVSIMADAGTQIEINSGNIYHQIVSLKRNADGNGYINGEVIKLDALSENSFVTIKDGIVMKPVYNPDGSLLCYQAFESGTETPTTTPTDPIKENEPANTTHNMIGIIALGAASVVMIAGVGAAIGITVKRRKKVKAA